MYCTFCQSLLFSLSLLSVFLSANSSSLHHSSCSRSPRKGKGPPKPNEKEQQGSFTSANRNSTHNSSREEQGEGGGGGGGEGGEREGEEEQQRSSPRQPEEEEEEEARSNGSRGEARQGETTAEEEAHDQLSRGEEKTDNSYSLDHETQQNNSEAVTDTDGKTTEQEDRNAAKEPARASNSAKGNFSTSLLDVGQSLANDSSVDLFLSSPNDTESFALCNFTSHSSSGSCNDSSLILGTEKEQQTWHTASIYSLSLVLFLALIAFAIQIFYITLRCRKKRMKLRRWRDLPRTPPEWVSLYEMNVQ